MKKFLPFFLTIALLSGLVLLVSCDLTDGEDNDKIPVANGYVLDYWGEWKDEYTPDNYQRYEVKALVANHGGDGTVTFRGTIEGDTIGTTETNISIFLRSAQQEVITFSFWAKGDSVIQVFDI